MQWLRPRPGWQLALRVCRGTRLARIFSRFSPRYRRSQSGESLQALGRPSLPPTTNGQKTHRLLRGDLLVGESPRQPQDDPSSATLPLATSFGVHDAHEFSLLSGAHFNPNRCWHDRPPITGDASIQSHFWDITPALIASCKPLSIRIRSLTTSRSPLTCNSHSSLKPMFSQINPLPPAPTSLSRAEPSRLPS